MSRIKNSQRQGKLLVNFSSTNAFRLIQNCFKNDIMSVQTNDSENGLLIHILIKIIVLL